MLQPFEAVVVDFELRAEGALVELALGALVHHSALVAIERSAVLLVLEEVLAHLGAHFLEQETQAPDERIIAQHRVGRLQEIAKAESREQAEERKPRDKLGAPRLRGGDSAGKASGGDHDDCECDKARREGKRENAGHVPCSTTQKDRRVGRRLYVCARSLHPSWLPLRLLVR